MDSQLAILGTHCGLGPVVSRGCRCWEGLEEGGSLRPEPLLFTSHSAGLSAYKLFIHTTTPEAQRGQVPHLK